VLVQSDRVRRCRYRLDVVCAASMLNISRRYSARLCGHRANYRATVSSPFARHRSLAVLVTGGLARPVVCHLCPSKHLPASCAPTPFARCDLRAIGIAMYVKLALALELEACDGSPAISLVHCPSTGGLSMVTSAECACFVLRKGATKDLGADQCGAVHGKKEGSQTQCVRVVPYRLRLVSRATLSPPHVRGTRYSTGRRLALHEQSVSLGTKQTQTGL
jgi:hypothetical protein